MEKMIVEYPRSLKVKVTNRYVEVATGEHFHVTGGSVTSVSGNPEPVIHLQSDAEVRPVPALVPLTRFIREFVDEETWREMTAKPEPPKSDVFVDKITMTEYVVTTAPAGALPGDIHLETLDGKTGLIVSLHDFVTNFFPAGIKAEDTVIEPWEQTCEQTCEPENLVDQGNEDGVVTTPSLYELVEYARLLQSDRIQDGIMHARLKKVYEAIDRRLGL